MTGKAYQDRYIWKTRACRLSFRANQNMTEPDIDLTEDERTLLAQIDFEWDFRRHDPESFSRNSEAVAQLITALLARGGIPEHRLKYFTEPDYRKGRLKGSRRDLFIRNRNTDEEILRHPHFLKYARYFVCGPDLPRPLMQEFREAVRNCGHVSSGDSIELANLARRQVRAFGLAPHDVEEEYFKLALDTGMWVSHALHIEERVKTLR